MGRGATGVSADQSKSPISAPLQNTYPPSPRLPHTALMSLLNGAIATNGRGRWLGVRGVVPWRAQAWTTGRKDRLLHAGMHWHMGHSFGSWQAGLVQIIPFASAGRKSQYLPTTGFGPTSRRAACLRRQEQRVQNDPGRSGGWGVSWCYSLPPCQNKFLAREQNMNI